MLDHDRNHSTAHQIHAANVDPHDSIENVGLSLDHVTHAADPRVVEQDVDPLEAFRNLCGNQDRLLLVGDVKVLGDRLAARFANRSDCCLRSAIVNVGDHDSGAFARKQKRTRLPDA